MGNVPGRRQRPVRCLLLFRVHACADTHTAGFVDALDAQVVAVLGVDSVGRILAGERNGGTKNDGVALDLGRCRTRRKKAGHGNAKRQGTQKFRTDRHKIVSSLVSLRWRPPTLPNNMSGGSGTVTLNYR